MGVGKTAESHVGSARHLSLVGGLWMYVSAVALSYRTPRPISRLPELEVRSLLCEMAAFFFCFAPSCTHPLGMGRRGLGRPQTSNAIHRPRLLSRTSPTGSWLTALASLQGELDVDARMGLLDQPDGLPNGFWRAVAGPAH